MFHHSAISILLALAIFQPLLLSISLNGLGLAGPSGFGSATTAEQVTEVIDASHLTVVITGHLKFVTLLTFKVGIKEVMFYALFKCGLLTIFS
ncbi:hypothetical protein HanOQP8_Chr13g0470441 [Helianthus annuus]|nr:hypothetical protein HanOQP8_Chr13g0470441 [Helianthus annuus]